MRILSLLPAATEIVYLLGLEKNLIGVSDDCNYPNQAQKLPKVTECLSKNLTSKEIDEKVKALGHMGMSISHLDQAQLKKLNPDLILTQDLCSVCAVSYSEVQKAARILDGETKIISLEPESIEDILENIILIGESSGKSTESRKIVKRLQQRLETMKSRLRRFARNDKPRVLIIEWLEPLMVAGHWVPEMVEKAGGVNLITTKGDRSYPITLDQIVAVVPDIVIFAPCGFNIQRTLKEKHLINNELNKIYDRIKNTSLKVYVVDGDAYMTRPGPRIIDGVEILAEIIYPEIFPRKHIEADWQFFTI